MRKQSAIVALMVCAALLAGCGGMSAEEQVVVQEQQLDEFISQADQWGEEILTRIPASELDPESEASPGGGVRAANDDYEEWPKFYYWNRNVELKSEGVRTPTEIADDLEPWLAQQGWQRDKESEFPASEESFERDYFRDGYHLVVEVFTEPPPRVQSLRFMIVTPQTDPDRT